MDTPSEAEFDDIARIAAQICGVPIALVTLLDETRQWFKARIGVDVEETPRAIAFCNYTIEQQDVMEVPDATGDTRFLDNPLVTGENHLRFYAGAPLRTPDGHMLGTLCVIDRRPHRLDQDQKAALAALARQVMAQLELRRAFAQQRTDRQRHHLILESAVDYAIVSMDLQGIVTSWNKGAELILGWTEREMCGRPCDTFFTPEDCAAGVPAREMQAALATGRGTDERWHLRRDGSRFWANGEMMPLLGDDGAAQGFLKIFRDRTAQHEAGTALKEAVSRLRRAQEAGGIGLFSVDREGMLDATPEFCRLFGVEECDKMPAAMLEALVVAEDRAHASDAMSRSAGTVPPDVQYRIRRADDGALRWIARKGHIECDGDGAPLRFVGAARDVTEEVEAKRDLATEREQLAQIFEQAPNFMAVLRGPEHRFERVNPGYIALVGRDVSGLPIAEVLPEAVEQGFVALLDEAYRSGEPYSAAGTLFVVQPKDAPAHERYVDFVYQPLRDSDGAITGIFVEGADVTDSKRAAAALRETEEELRLLNAELEVRVEERTRERDRAWRNSRDLIVVIDTGGVFLEVSPAAERLLGWAPEEMVGKNILDFIHPDDHAPIDNALEVAAAGTMPMMENRYRHRDGGYRWLSWTAGPDGDLITATARDVTEARAQAAELAHTQDALRQAQKMEAVGQLTGGIAHDFNNLLTGIIGSLDLMQRKLAAGRGGEIDRYVSAAVTSANRAAALTHRLLAFSRRQPLDPKAVDANRLIASMEDLIRRTIGEAVQLEMVVAGGLWRTLCDPHQLENAILNLAINARDAMPDGGKLTIETCNARLDDAYAANARDIRPGQYVCICVSDTGTGMSAETIEKAFEPFYTTKPIGQGTGLGLSMIYGFARQSEGYAKIYSEVGRGTTMKLYLPRHYADADAPEDAALATRDVVGSADGEMVLVVEDEPAVRELVLDVLADLGYRTLAAIDGPSGLKILQSEEPIDLLVTDVGLPGLNGRQLADAARLRRPDLKILFMTGYAENAAINGGFLDAGMELITKPFAIDALSQKVRTIIEG